MFCSVCGTQQADAAQACAVCAGVPVTSANTSTVTPASGYEPLPPGIAGWSWGAFLMNWIWAIGNRTWIGLLAIVPFIGFFVSIWLGVKGREMAWKNKHWDSVEHFKRVQRTWTIWGVVLCLAPAVLITISMVAVAIPAYQGYVEKSRQAQLRFDAQKAADAAPAVQ
ncbi:hypothetical protein G4G28_20840 [Massilia sp. Dwa41.01b]|uniref:hypothetical protein n=1 Tax=unclassified Massilia TaxID=2609279 RepID=UPI001602F00D|nr:MULTISPECIES: hypothetical protein [unclassified Massilia]QNA90336.1 hypothetical protein G4G28_20840 [Massilia sp. Dwa41.01b]QNB01236.1 hypothetical protein G4G31_24470 [Massilia sp. Se16.2.3]